ncbi:LysM peptidoglycan-binding domain-containing protein [Antarcticirhabdus aurantiaca]|uniref:LysM peptidoglycan-binding domain-containing protein n=1 Tax=Antarcticirhabdus aurantiaca TaxID=2606717 RepID=A0ACD4NTI3_9HYPH|nr:LysM peptidoglycan-binding domain-containing protein [Antarcticirhabdus aurantiaca]WAJ30113.1 LysM peptidoglycan-binding domain-containing protein [Jeongeuplla avenae]
MRKRATGILLFCVFLLAAIVAGYLDMLNSERERLAQLGSLEALRDGAAAGAPAPASSRSAASGGQSAAPAPAVPVAAEAGAAEAKAPGEDKAPRFDILRAEPNGDLVVAGQAPAGATVALFGNGREIARETASEGGSFAMVLPEPLTPGAHQLALSATMPDGSRAESPQTALVDVPPAGKEDQLLAMIEEPNAPSRIVEAPKPAGAEGGEAAALAVPAAPDVRAEPPVAAAAPVAPAARAPASVAAAALANGASDAAQEPRAPSPLVVEAVEIENGRVFVAGTGAAGLRVRVYLDNALVGEAPVSRDGRFFVTARRDVPVGGHTVRADQVAADGSVAYRAEVPFARPDDGAMSAIASSEAPPATAEPVPSAATEPREDEDAGTDVAVAAMPEPVAQERDEPFEMSAAPIGSSSDPAPAAAKGPTEAAGERAAEPEVVAPAVSQPPASTETASDGSAEPVVATVQQAPLTTVEGRVIIRRGDSLWRISRDLYGAGRRYTVIYLANGDQIRDPDRIYPGQVFRVPNEAADGAENEG